MKMLTLISGQQKLRKQCFKTLALSERQSRGKQKALGSTFSAGFKQDLKFLQIKPGWVSALSNHSNNQTPKQRNCFKLVESSSKEQLCETPRLLCKTLNSFRGRGTSCDLTNEVIQRKQLKSINIGRKYEVKVFRHNDTFIFKLYSDREYKDQVKLPLGELEDIIQYGIDDQSDEQIGNILNDKLKKYLSVVLGVKLLINIPKKESQQIKEEEGPSRVNSVLSQLNSAQYNSFINSLRKVQDRVRKKTMKQVQQLKKLRQDRPPIITKGVVRLNGKFYRFAAFGEENTPIIELDFFDLSSREYSVKCKSLQVTQMSNLLGPKVSEEVQSKYGKLRLVRNFLHKLRDLSTILSHNDLSELVDLSLQVEENN